MQCVMTDGEKRMGGVIREFGEFVGRRRDLMGGVLGRCGLLEYDAKGAERWSIVIISGKQARL